MVVTTKAKTKIKDSLKEEKKQIAELGKTVLEKRLNSINAVINHDNLEELATFYKNSSVLDLLYDIAIKKNDLKELKDFTIHGDKILAPRPVKQVEEHPEQKPLSKKDTELIIFGESSDKIKYTLANCCKPIPGDDVFGFVTTGEGLKIHRTNCKNATRLLASHAHRVVKTKWAKNKEISFLTGLKIIGLDDVGVIHKITNLLSGELKVNISAMTIEANHGVFEGNVKIFVQDKEQLNNIVTKLLELSGIERVDRYDTEESA